jgi:hypothetical protein
MSQPSRTTQTRSSSLQDRGEQCAAVQRQLKQEAADRREIALAAGPARQAVGLSQRSRPGRPHR